VIRGGGGGGGGDDDDVKQHGMHKLHNYLNFTKPPPFTRPQNQLPLTADDTPAICTLPWEGDR
jgi:hypothetical protein